jgi:hypothetical protein
MILSMELMTTTNLMQLLVMLSVKSMTTMMINVDPVTVDFKKAVDDHDDSTNIEESDGMHPIMGTIFMKTQLTSWV